MFRLSLRSIAQRTRGYDICDEMRHARSFHRQRLHGNVATRSGGSSSHARRQEAHVELSPQLAGDR